MYLHVYGLNKLLFNKCAFTRSKIHTHVFNLLYPSNERARGILHNYNPIVANCSDNPLKYCLVKFGMICIFHRPVNEYLQKSKPAIFHTKRKHNLSNNLDCRYSRLSFARQRMQSIDPPPLVRTNMCEYLHPE